MSDGVYLNKETGEVSTTQPTRARVLVQPGDPIPPKVRELLDGPKVAEGSATAEPVAEKATKTPAKRGGLRKG